MSDTPGTADDSLSGDELRTATASALRWTVIARPVVECVLVGSMIILAHLVPPADFGRYAVAVIAMELTMVPTQGVGTALVQRASVSRAHLQSGFALSLLMGAAIIGLTLAASALIVTPVFGGRTADLVRLSIPASFVTSACVVPGALLQRRLQFARVSMTDVIITSTRAATSIALAIAGLNGAALVLGAVASTVAGAAVQFAWAPPPLPRLYRGPAKDLLSYGLPAAAAAISWVGFRNCDYAIVGARLGVLRAGLYFRAYTLGVEYQKKISQVMTTVGFPVLARAHGSGEMEVYRARMARTLALVLFPLLTLLSIVAPVFVPWMLGSAWTAAVVPTQILALGGAATLVIDTVGVVLAADGRPRSLLVYGWAHFISYGTAVFLVAPLGLVAVATAAAVVHTVFLFVAYVMMLRGSPGRALALIWDDVGPATVCCLGLAAAAVPAGLWLSSIGTPAIVHLALVSLIGGIAYLATLRLCFPESLRKLWSLVTRVVPVERIRAAARVLPLRRAETQPMG